MNFEEAMQQLKLPFELADLQVADIKELAPFDKIGLFWDVGVGKTVASTVLAKMWESDRNLIVMPPVLLRQWKDWLNLVDPNKTVTIYYGPKRRPEDLKGDWVLTSHAIFRTDIEKIVKLLAGVNITLIVDEAQAAKNVQSKLFKAVKLLGTANKLQMLTATPTSKPEDAYSYINLKTPHLYRGIGHFKALYIEEYDFFNNPLKYRDLDKLSEHLMLQASKRTKEQVFAGRLNPPIYQTIRYDLDPKHLKLYNQLVEECMLELTSSGETVDATTPQRMYHTTQQMVMNYGYFADKPDERAQGMDLLDLTIEQTNCMDQSSSKLMVWIYYIRTAAMLTEYLAGKFGAEAVATANGKTNSAKAVDRFLNDSSCRILVAHPDSVGIGLNAMTVCWEALFLEFATVSMKNRQAIGRIDRMGQQHIPNVRFAVANGTVQEHLLSTLFSNDDRVSTVERNPQTLRQALLGR